MRSVFLFSLIILIPLTCMAQQGDYKVFTVNDGLPSNYIYRCMEDDKGFLWIGTDAGIARFDGKHFQVFTTRQGLPDNDVLSIAKEKNGRIWVNCFKQSPAYFDETQNRFINAKEDSNLAKVSGAGEMYLFGLPAGGVMYYNSRGSFIFRDKKPIDYNTERKTVSFVIKENEDGSVIKYGSDKVNLVLRTGKFKMYHIKEGKYLDSINISAKQYDDMMSQFIDDGKLYLFNGSKSKVYIYSDINTTPLRFKLDSISLPESFFNYSITPNYVYLLTHTGKIYVMDKNRLQQSYVLSGNYIPNSFYDDSKGNSWVSTIDKGLVLYKKKQFAHIEMPIGFTRTNFFSMAKKTGGGLLAGNYYGEVIETHQLKFDIHTISENGFTRPRKIILSKKNVFTFSDEGVTVNYTKPIRYLGKKTFFSIKTAIVYNDSIMIAGYNAGLLKVNSDNQTITKISPTAKRVTALVKANNGMIYFGSLDGLYKFHYPENKVIPLAENSPLLAERVTALCTTPDSLVWVATPSNGILAVKNDKVLLAITTRDGIINNSFRSLTAGKPGQVWLGTDAGISVIHYKVQDNKVSASIQNITINDGLASNEVNEMIYHNDTMYAATAGGISIVPADIYISKFNIPVQILNISINQRDTVITNKYDLRYDQQNIFIRFAAIELSGHFKNIQYALDDSKKWTNLQENTLNLQLSNGDHTIKVRAVDVNGNVSDKILSIGFTIATPFWKAIWFWIIVFLSLQSLAILFVFRWQVSRKKAKLVKEMASLQTASLEQQAFTSLMNPHFMFNALNSIQHYINVQDRQNANRYLTDFASLIRKNFESAQQSFIPLEQELENIRIYLRLEQMRFTNKFTYHIAIDHNLDIENWMIPTMMLQPLLENALLHGIMRSNIDGLLEIELKEQDKNLLITITDNGIGVANSSAAKVNSGHKSHGMGLIKKRIAALSHFVSQPVTISMSPAFEDETNPGNKIILFIPGSLYSSWLQAQQ
ncbi:MAG: two-component regulator propeller domain-containing protein [Bacteroidota bacterium]